MRWVLAGQPCLAGRLVDAPGVLGELLRTGVIARALVEPGMLWTWLDEPRWPEYGTIVRDAIAAAIPQLDGWQIEPADDEVLHLVSGDVVDRALGPWIASHGGRITLLGAAGDVVEVRLEGACSHCAAAGLTIHGRVQTAIGQRLGRAVEVQATGLTDGHAGRAMWLPWRGRR